MAYSKQTWSSNELITADKLNHIEDGIAGKKDTQSAVSSPSASGTAVAFIDSISQNAQGVISPTKKSIPEATTSAAGLMSSSDKTKLNGIASGAQVNSITGIKGNAESSYRTGNVNLTPANIGAVAKSGDTMTGHLQTTGNIQFLSDDFPVIEYITADGSTMNAQIRYCANGNFEDGRFKFREYRPNGSTYEDFDLPIPDASGNKVGYDILTAKSAVTIPQGGTGATSQEGARANLGALGSFPTFVSFGGSATNFYQNLGVQIGTMADYESRIFLVYADATSEPFYQYHTYSGTIMRYSSTNCAGILTDETGQAIIIGRSNGTWSARAL